MYSVIALQVANNLNIKRCRWLLALPVCYSDSDELFLSNGNEKYIYLFQYGVVAFFNHSTSEINAVLSSLGVDSSTVAGVDLSETMIVEVIEGKQEVAFDKVVLPRFDEESLRLVLLNTSQSVALDRYLEITDGLLEETSIHTKSLETSGRLKISGKNLKKFIGKVLNIKNQISENLYIFDSPEVTWENEALNTLNAALKQTFDLKDRYRYIYERTAIIKEDLELFKDIMDHRESSKLEWIIIVLILFEVVDLFVFRLF
jgi:required for meiotic nuclear division protein 1